MREAAQLIFADTDLRPKLGIVLGSGLGSFADSLTGAARFPYRELPGMPHATAVGHQGELVIGKLGATPVAVMSGRFHLYEGYTASEAASGIRLFHAMGIQRIVLTNAAGGINPNYAPGELVLITDHINLQGDNPLIGPNDETTGPRFPDMTEAYSLQLRRMALETARDENIALQQGVYAALRGPSYETPAEIRYLRIIGADLVGMSTVAETVTANHMGMEVLGISCVTNIAAGLSGKKLDHQEVLDIGQRVSGTFQKLLSALLPRIA